MKVIRNGGTNEFRNKIESFFIVSPFKCTIIWMRWLMFIFHSYATSMYISVSYVSIGTTLKKNNTQPKTIDALFRPFNSQFFRNSSNDSLLPVDKYNKFCVCTYIVPCIMGIFISVHLVLILCTVQCLHKVLNPFSPGVFALAIMP